MLFSFAGLALFGQTTVTGEVLTANGTPLEFATVTVHRLSADSSLLQAGYTDAGGNFSLTISTNERVRVTASALAYYDAEMQGTVADRFTFRLEAASAILSEIRVAGRRLSTYALQGGVALDVANNTGLTGSSGLEILELLPAVSLEGQSGVSVRGNTNVRLFINGQETKRTTASLRNISAERIERVELYTSPPARFDADGSGGIINIILRKSQRPGRRLTLDGQVTAPGRLGGGFQGELNGKRWLAAGGLRLGYSDFRSSFSSLTEFPDRQLRLFSQTTGIQYTPEGNFSVRLRPDTTLTLQLAGNYQGWYLRNSLRQFFDQRVVIAAEREAEDEGSLDLSLDWQPVKNQTLGISLRASGERENNGGESDARTEDRIPRLTRTEESQLLRQVNSAYTLAPRGLKLLRLGTKYDLVDFDTRQTVALAAPVITEFVAALRKAGYFLEAEWERNGWSVYAGLRYEAYTARVRAENTVGENGYRGFFPSLSVTHSAGDVTWQATYSRRLDRPGFFDLVPIVTYNSPVARETGNPFLLPEINDRWELTHRRTAERVSFSGTAFLDRKDNLIQSTLTEPEPGVLLLRPENEGRRLSWGVEGSIEFSGERWSTQLTGNANRTRFQREDVRGGSTRLRLRQEFSFPGRWTVQAIGLLRGQSQSLRQLQDGYLTFDLVLSKRFGEKGSSLTFRAQDIFDQRVFQYTVTQGDLREMHTYKWQTRKVSLNFRLPLLK